MSLLTLYYCRCCSSSTTVTVVLTDFLAAHTGPQGHDTAERAESWGLLCLGGEPFLVGILAALAGSDSGQVLSDDGPAGGRKTQTSAKSIW